MYPTIRVGYSRWQSHVSPEFTLVSCNPDCRTEAFIFCRGVLVAGSGVARAESVYSFATTPGRLPKNVVPTHYAIDLKPDLATLAVGGSEVVDIKVLAPTDRLVLNAVDMTLQSASLEGEPGKLRRLRRSRRPRP